jgi:hypothetical protein
LRIAYFDDTDIYEVAPFTKRAIKIAVENAEKLGHTCFKVTLPN